MGKIVASSNGAGISKIIAQTSMTDYKRLARKQGDDLCAARETIAVLRKAYEKIAVEYHLAKVGGTATHSGSLERCKNKGCVEHSRTLAQFFIHVFLL